MRAGWRVIKVRCMDRVDITFSPFNHKDIVIWWEEGGLKERASFFFFNAVTNAGIVVP